MKSLKLILKRKWFDMISDGYKTEEYRELKSYYLHRLFQMTNGGKIDEMLINEPRYIPILKKAIEMKAFICKHTHVTFYCGYQAGRDEMVREIESIRIGEGKPEWGAEPGKLYFVIRLKQN